MTHPLRRSCALVLAGVVAASVLLASSPAAAVTSGLPSSQKVLDLGFDGTLSDSSPGANAVTTLPNGASPTYTDGVAGQALRLNGSTALSLGTNPQLQPQDLALSFWFRPTTAMGSGEQMFSWNKTVWNADGWYLSSENANTPLALSIGPSSGQPYKVSVKQSRDSFFPVNQWTNVVVSYNRTTKAVSFYRNGVAVPTTTDYAISAAATGVLGSTTGQKSIGYNGPEYRGAYLRGDLDEWRLWNGVATAADAIDLYAEYADADAGPLLESDLARVPLPATLTESTLSLPSRTASGADITWSSDSAAVVVSGTNATVTRPTDANGSATLTARVALAGETRTRAFPVTILASSAAARLEYLADAYVLRPTLVSGTPQPELGNGTTTQLATSTPGVTVDNRTINTTSDTAVSTDITATFTLDGARTTRSYSVTLLPAQRADYVLGYQRTPLAANVYGPKVANSLHLAVGDDASTFQALNGNRGVAFAKGTPTDRVDVLAARTLRSPSLFQMEQGYGVLALRADASGTKDETTTDSALLLTTPDLENYSEAGLVKLGAGGGVNAPRAVWDSVRKMYLVTWTDDAGRPWTTTFTSLTNPATRGALRSGAPTLSEQLPSPSIDGAIPSSILSVPEQVGQGLRNRFGRIINTGVTVAPTSIAQGDAFKPEATRATLTYSDNSTAERAVDWNMSEVGAVNTNVPGEYTVTGTVRQREYSRPFLRAEADPDIYQYKGKYLFISTDDTNIIGTSRMFLRQADTIDGLKTAADYPVAGTGGATGIAGCFWAPELHEIGGKLTIFFAPCVGSASWTNVRSHVMQLRDGGNPTVQADWSAPKEVRTAAGGLLQLDAAHPGISLDMTYFEDAGRHYVSWAQRYIADVNGDSELWIATIDPADPSRLTSAPRKLVSPEYGWDLGTQNVAEGPYFLRSGNRIFLTYSGSGIDATYAVGLLEITSGQDLTDQKAWHKFNAPILSSDLPNSLYGPGHNSFTYDEDGVPLIVFHAKDSVNSYRHAYINRVHFNAEGLPVLDMTRDEEVAPRNRTVTAKITVTSKGAAANVSTVSSLRCVAGKAMLVTTVRNESTVPVNVTVTSRYGTKTSSSVAPGKNVSQTFTTRATSVPAGSTSTSAVATESGSVPTTTTADYAALSCG